MVTLNVLRWYHLFVLYYAAKGSLQNYCRWYCGGHCVWEHSDTQDVQRNARNTPSKRVCTARSRLPHHLATLVFANVIWWRRLRNGSRNVGSGSTTYTVLL